MKEIDAVLDQNPSQAIEFIKLDIRNRQAYNELKHFELTGDFLWIHPILQKKKLENQFRKLKRDDPRAFMENYVNNDKNITRYKSQLKQGKAKSEKEKQNWEKHISRISDENEIMKNILNE
jgi:hypothetical protein